MQERFVAVGSGRPDRLRSVDPPQPEAAVTQPSKVVSPISAVSPPYRWRAIGRR